MLESPPNPKVSAPVLDPTCESLRVKLPRTTHLSPPLMKKIEDVLRRPFGLGETQVYGIIRLFRDTFSIVSPERDLSVVTADPDDNRILEAASAAGADAIISGDTHLPDLAEWNGIPVLTPDTFLQKFLSA